MLHFVLASQVGVSIRQREPKGGLHTKPRSGSAITAQYMSIPYSTRWEGSSLEGPLCTAVPNSIDMRAAHAARSVQYRGVRDCAVLLAIAA
jgi:hypothetical protein